VSVRVRPLNKQEQQEGFAWRLDNNTLVQCDPYTKEPDRTRDTKYILDNAFDPGSTTQQIYEATTLPLVHKVVSGFNSTVFAYGQTSSGKTHTMRGSDADPGIIPLAVHGVFSLIEACQDREFLLRVSYMEVRPVHAR
jgi:centromeric protein E